MQVQMAYLLYKQILERIFMAEKIIKGLGEEEKLIVQKSYPLLDLWKSDLSFRELKFLEVYLSRINSHDPDGYKVELTKAELEKVLGVTKINRKEMETCLQHLMQTIVRIPDKEKEKGINLISLFDRAYIETCDDGVSRITMSCGESARKYVFNIENLRYIRYRLKSVVSLQSKQAYILFLYLEKNRYRKEWTVPLNELKFILSCDNDAAYEKYKVFNDRVLKRIHKEICEKTDCRYNYEPVKAGRKVIAIQFTLDDMAILEDHAEDGIPENNEEIAKSDALSSTFDLWKEPLKNLGLTDAEYKELFSLLVTIPDQNLPGYGVPGSDLSIMRYHYIDQQVARLSRITEKKKVNDRFAYLKSMLREDATRL